MGDDDLDAYRTESQKEWKRWADDGYRKRSQPRAMLWFGGVFCIVFGGFLVTIFWLASTGRLP